MKLQQQSFGSFTRWASLWLAFMWLLPALGTARDNPLTDEEVVTRTVEGHHLRLPKDWPVERRDGHISPVPMEEYLSMKFRAIHEAFDATTRTLEALERRIQTLEQGHRTLQRRVSDLEGTLQGPAR